MINAWYWKHDQTTPPPSLSLHQIKEDIVIYFIDALVLEYKPNNPSIEVL